MTERDEFGEESAVFVEGDVFVKATIDSYAFISFLSGNEYNFIFVMFHFFSEWSEV